jgi:putative Ca2+/H+ antiporter (TMEM165/GDT1 family)
MCGLPALQPPDLFDGELPLSYAIFRLLKSGLVGEWVDSLVNSNNLRWVLGISFLAVAAWGLIPDMMDDDV